MSYDGMVTFAAAHELRRELLLGKIEKIYQPGPEQLLLSIHTQRGRRRLFVSAAGNHSAAYLIDHTPENPVIPPVFCMVLRKHLGAARIVAVEQHENDRILEISLETVDEMGFSVNRKLIIELMGKHSNILLVDMGSGRIIDCIKHVSIDVNRARQLIPGKTYEYPPLQHKTPFTEVTEEDIRSMMSNALQPERDLLNGIQGISPALAQTLANAGFGGDQANGTAFEPDRAYAALREMVQTVREDRTQPVVYLNEDGKPVDFHITPLSLYEGDPACQPLRFDTLSGAAEYFFVHRESSNTIRQKSNDLQRVIRGALDKAKLKLQRLGDDLQKAEKADQHRLYGELLTANLHLVEPGAKSVTVVSYYDGSEVKIPLDPRFSPSRNAQNYYRKYGKAKTAIHEKTFQMEETTREIEYLESVLSFAERAGSIEELDLIRTELVDAGLIRYRKKAANQPRKKAKPAPYTYRLTSGKTVLAGRNNKENDWLTLKRASGTDLWFHTKDIPGSHVILLLDREEPTEEDLAQAAGIAAYHSKASASGNVPVDYTKVRHVKKPAGARPGMVIFTHNKTLYVDPELPQPDAGK
ncbi:MAG: NFACT family protein [Firmicutes bacterium]|nr:NFACT family protein [Bacillota bacterium]